MLLRVREVTDSKFDGDFLVCPHEFWDRLIPRHIRFILRTQEVQLEYLVATVQGQLRSGRAGPFVKVEGCCD
jgi:hypothetical protein